MGFFVRLRLFANRLLRSSKHHGPQYDNLRPSSRICFHPSRGKDVHRSRDGTTVYKKKKRWMWKKPKNALSFSSRTIAVNEVMTIDLTNVAVVVGVVFQNPDSLERIKSSFEIFSNGHGFGIVLPKQRTSSVQFYYNANGDVLFSVDNEDVALFFEAVDPQVAPWILIDMYNNDKRLSAMDKEAQAVQPVDRSFQRSSLCDICCEQPPNAVLGECGHCSCCYDCARRWLAVRLADRPCPYCRSRVTCVVKDMTFIKKTTNRL